MMVTMAADAKGARASQLGMAEGGEEKVVSSSSIVSRSISSPSSKTAMGSARQNPQQKKAA